MKKLLALCHLLAALFFIQSLVSDIAGTPWTVNVAFGLIAGAFLFRGYELFKSVQTEKTSSTGISLSLSSATVIERKIVEEKASRPQPNVADLEDRADQIIDNIHKVRIKAEKIKMKIYEGVIALGAIVFSFVFLVKNLMWLSRQL